MKHLFLSFLLLVAYSCKNENAQVDYKADTSAPVDPANLTVPSSCALITEAQVEEILKTKSGVSLKEANNPQDNKTKACFFKWEDDATPNVGILIQLMTNPVYEEYPEYVQNFISNKLSHGEMEMGSNQPVAYHEFNAGGKRGAYSFQQARFYWAYNNNYLFMLAFNISTMSEAKMKKAASKIAEILNKNMDGQIK